jgi:hypothetical protein
MYRLFANFLWWSVFVVYNCLWDILIYQFRFLFIKNLKNIKYQINFIYLWSDVVLLTEKKITFQLNIMELEGNLN